MDTPSIPAVKPQITKDPETKDDRNDLNQDLSKLSLKPVHSKYSFPFWSSKYQNPFSSGRHPHGPTDDDHDPEDGQVGAAERVPAEGDAAVEEGR